jgi:hypothetical protein
MSVLLFDRLHGVVRIGKRNRKDMKNKHSSVSITTANAQSRTVKCYFDASADSLLNIAVISITDRLFKEEKNGTR